MINDPELNNLLRKTLVTFKIHVLKINNEFFHAIAKGEKTFEVRKNDRNFRVGDVLYLKEYSQKIEEYSGDKIYKKIIYILEGGQFGIEPGYVVLGLG